MKLAWGNILCCLQVTWVACHAHSPYVYQLLKNLYHPWLCDFSAMHNPYLDELYLIQPTLCAVALSAQFRCFDPYKLCKGTQQLQVAGWCDIVVARELHLELL